MLLLAFSVSGVVCCRRWSERASPWGHSEGELTNNNAELLVALRGEGTERCLTLHKCKGCGGQPQRSSNMDKCIYDIYGLYI